MDTLVKADFFFFLTSISVVILTILLAVLLGYCIMVFRNLKHITNKARKQADELEKDIENARDYIEANGLTLRTLLKLKDFFIAPKKRKK